MRTLGRERRKLFVWLCAIVALLLAAMIGWSYVIWSVYLRQNNPLSIADASGTTDIRVSALGNGFFCAARRWGGNITVSIGPNGVLLVDTGRYKDGPALQLALSQLINLRDVKETIVVNTHAHADHRGGNPAFRKLGANILAQNETAENILAGALNPNSASEVPNIVYEKRHSFTFNNQSVNLIHTPFAHTNGDTLVHFSPANIIATGDVFYHEALPGLSLAKGGSVGGLIDGMDVIMALADADTLLVPGHGPLAREKDLAKARRALSDVRDYIAFLKSWGVSKRFLPAFHPMYAWPREWRTGMGRKKTMSRVYWKAIP